MQLSFYNFVTGVAMRIDSQTLTHELARQLVPQDQATQAAYEAARRAGETPNGAMTRANLARSDGHGRR
jgi:hypothetical protein